MSRFNRLSLFKVVTTDEANDTLNLYGIFGSPFCNLRNLINTLYMAKLCNFITLLLNFFFLFLTELRKFFLVQVPEDVVNRHEVILC